MSAAVHATLPPAAPAAATATALSPEAVAHVRATWGLVTRAPADLAAAFYGRLFAAHPHLRPLFRDADLTAQGEKLTQTLAVVVRGIDDLPRLAPAVAALGRRHAGYGATDAHYPVVGEVLLATLADVLGDDFTPPVREAWTAAYGAVAAVMRAGAEG